MLLKAVKIKPFVILLVLALFISSCMKEEEEPKKTMESIRNEEGVPVKVKEIKTKRFEKKLTFFAKLEGHKESVRGSSIGDKVLKINNRVGDFVKAGKVVVEFPLDIPSMQYEQAKAAFEISQKNYNRMKNLLEAGEISQMQYDGVETEYLVNKRNFESIKQALFVESPISGTIVEIYVREGDMIVSNMPGQPVPLFKVSQLERMIAKVWVSGDEIQYIKKGMKAIGRWNGGTYSGTISDIALAMDEKRNAFQVEISFPNPKRELKSGTTIDLDVIIYSNDSAIVVPQNLIVTEAGKSYIYVAENDKAVKKLISTGNVSGISFEVREGLRSGEMLITEGSTLLNNGTKVKILNTGGK